MAALPSSSILTTEAKMENPPWKFPKIARSNMTKVLSTRWPSPTVKLWLSFDLRRKPSELQRWGRVEGKKSGRGKGIIGLGKCEVKITKINEMEQIRMRRQNANCCKWFVSKDTGREEKQESESPKRDERGDDAKTSSGWCQLLSLADAADCHARGIGDKQTPQM